MHRLLFTALACLISVNLLSQTTFTESHLPIIIIEYENEIDEIPDEPRVLATMGIIDNGEGDINQIDDLPNIYFGNIGIETRGNSTQMFEKKTYTIELWDDNMEDQALALLGMEEEEDWILHAMVIDKTQFRIPFSFDLTREMGHYASNYRFVELIINDEYRGLYILTEKIKRDNNRVDIAKLDIDDLEGRAVTGGYILRIDWTWDIDDYEYFISDYNSQGGDPMTYQYYYPKAENIQQSQKDYIKEWMDAFEDAVFSDDFFANGNRYTEFIDVTSFTDFLIINELSKNSDGYKLSTYMHKDRIDSDDRLHAGPIWDFDQTYGMSAVCSNYDPTGWTYLQEQEWCEDLQSMPMFWQSMMSDTVFTNHLSCRWSTLRQGPLHIDSLFHRIDAMNTYVGEAITRNFIRWDFQGQNIWIEPYPLPLETHQEEVEYMKNWIQDRIEWLDLNMPGNCMNDVISKIPEQEADLFFNVFPNPASNNLTIDLGDLTDLNTTIKLYDSASKLVFEKQSTSTLFIDVSIYAKGLYTLELSTTDQVLRSQVVIE